MSNDVQPAHHLLKQIIPGVILCLVVMFIGIYGAQVIGWLLIQVNILPKGSASPISGIFVAILIGIILRNTVGLRDVFTKGVAFSLKYALRAGIILLGLRLSLAEAVKLGTWGLPLIISSISCGLIVTLYFTSKLNQSSRLGTLIATGTGICGVTAIMAISPVVKAKDNEISYAVANITTFGLIGMLFYPYLANVIFAGDPVKTGLFLGTAIHDTAQVTGSALIYHEMFDLEKVVDIATVTKLTRNLFIIAVIPLVSYLFYKKMSQAKEIEPQELPKWYQFIPLFVIGFLLLSFFRTIGDITLVQFGDAFGILQPKQWQSLYEGASSLGSTYFLGTAMAGVGLSTDFSMFKGLGIKPFYIGFIAAISVGLVSMIVVSLFGHMISL